MTNAKITGVNSVDLGVSDLNASKAFYTDIWGLTPVSETPSSIFLRGGGPLHHILVLHGRPTAEVLRINLIASNPGDIDALHENVHSSAARSIEPPAKITEPGGGYGFSFQDPEDRTVRIIAGADREDGRRARADEPLKISHIVINTPKRDEMTEYYSQALGLRVIDRTKLMTFLCAGSDHHCIAFAQHPVSTLNHIAFETSSLDSVMRGAGRLRDRGIPLEWGVGRHGPGNNVFAYFLGPDGEVVEYTSDVQQVDETYRSRGLDEWVWPAGRIDHWGIAHGPTENLNRAQDKMRFAPYIFHNA